MEAYMGGTPQRRRGSATPQMDFLPSHQFWESSMVGPLYVKKQALGRTPAQWVAMDKRWKMEY
jgi:hypothetical protein